VHTCKVARTRGKLEEENDNTQRSGSWQDLGTGLELIFEWHAAATVAAVRPQTDIFVSACLSVCLLVCLFVYPDANGHIYMFHDLLSISLFICLSIYICLYVIITEKRALRWRTGRMHMHVTEEEGVRKREREISTL